MALLSVVVPAYNVAGFLPACLDSLLADAPDDIQIVGVDDASPDECGAIFDAYARRDARLRVLHLEPNAGLGPARNAGLDAATGEFVWFVDGDDVLAPGAAAHVASRLRRDRPDLLLLQHAWLVDGRVRSEPHGVRVPRFPGLLSVNDRPTLLRVRQAAWNRVARRSLLDQPALRFPTGWYEDIAFSHLSLVAATRVAAVAQPAYLYRQRGGAITATVSPRHFEVFAQYERLFVALATWSVNDEVRAELFELMLEHYLVIVGTEGRIPPPMRQEFFGRIVEHYHRFLPAEGYESPHGLAGMKLRFVRWDAYGLFDTARAAYRTGRRAQRAVGARLHGGRPANPT